MTALDEATISHMDDDLSRAACRGWPEPLWDERVHGETHEQRQARHDRARAICAACPATLACAARRDERDGGVWAGQLHTGPGIPVGLLTHPGRAPRQIGDVTAVPCVQCGQDTVTPHMLHRHPHLRASCVPRGGRGMCSPCYTRQRPKIREAG